jgi:hypothetical protein
MATLEELRERAKTDLRVLFGVSGEEINETLIMYMLGLYTSGADVVRIAIDRMNAIEFARLNSLYPPYPEADEPEKTEEQKAKERWEKVSK